MHINDKQAKSSITHLGTGTNFEGSIDAPHDLFIYGNFTGQIQCKNNISIGAKAVIKANITAKSAVIAGTIEGDLICSGTVELEETAVLVGNLTARELIIHKGAKFQGNSSLAVENQ